MFNLTIILVVLLALFFDFINGFHDTANSIATTISTRVLPPKTTIVMAATLNFIGALVSENVAKTISSGIITKDSINTEAFQYVVISTLIAAIIWNLITWKKGLPSSSSHALIGGLIDAALADIKNIDYGEVPYHLRDHSFSRLDGKGQEIITYKYPHDYPETDFVIEQQYLPDILKNKKYYKEKKLDKN